MCAADVRCNLHGCKTFIFIFCPSFCLLPPFLFFCMRSVFFFLPPSFSQPACRCLQTTWRLTVICSRFPKPTIWARRKLTGLRSHAPVRDTMAATHLGEAGTASNIPTTIMMSLLRRTCGHKTSTVMEGVTLHLVTTDTTAVLAVTRPPHVTQRSQGPQGPPRGTLRTHQ